jgi:hypothetical protein
MGLLVTQSERDGWRELADLEGELTADFDLAEYTATLRLETYDRPLGVGARITSVQSTVVRYPRVTKIDDSQNSPWTGGSRASVAGGRNGPARFTLSATAEYTDSAGVARGVSLEQLSQEAPGGEWKRFTILLTGPDVAQLLHGGDLYMIDSTPVRSADALSSSVDLARAPIYDPTDGA